MSPWTLLIRKSSLYLCQYNLLFYFFQHPQTSFSYILTTYRYFSAYGNPTTECHYQTMFKSGNGFNICSLSNKIKKICVWSYLWSWPSPHLTIKTSCEESGSWLYTFMWFFRPDSGNYKPYLKAVLSISDLVHSQCTAVSEGRVIQGLKTL